MMEKKDSKIKIILGMMILPLAFSLAFFACSSPDLDIDKDTEMEIAVSKLEKEGVIIQKIKPGEKIETDGQMDEVTNVFTVVEEMPFFKGGVEEMYLFLGNNIKYPEQAKKDLIEGVVYVNFIIEKDGKLTNAKVLRGIGGGCDEEAIRAVSSMPNWTPGKQRGKYVRVSYNLPIKFAIE